MKKASSEMLDAGGFTRSELLAAAAAGLFAFALYFYSLPQVITGEDAGELTTAAYTLGIPHPPGYPTWCLLAHPFTWIPFGSVAWRVALSSAVFGALAVFVTGLIAARLTRSAGTALWVGMFLAIVPSVYSQSFIADVYALNLLLLAASLLLAIRWDETRAPRTLYQLALLMGLGQGVHNTQLVVAAVLGGYVLLREPSLLRRPKVIAACCVCFGTGCAVFLYLPLRSLANPVPDWGNPESWQAFLDHVMRTQFAFMYNQYPRSFTGILWQYLPLLPYLLIVVVTTWVLRRRTPGTLPHLWLVAAVGLAPVAVIVWLQNPLPNSLWGMVMTPFWMPAALVLVLSLGLFFAKLEAKPDIRISLILQCLTLIFTFALYFSFPSGKRNYHDVDDYARSLLMQLPPEAVLFADADHLVFPIMYLQQVEGIRRDVTLGNPYGYVDTTLLNETARGQWGVAVPRRMEPAFFAALLAESDRPVYFSRRVRFTENAPFLFRQEGMLYRAVPDGADTTPQDIWNLYPWNDQMLPYRLPGEDLTQSMIVAEYFTKRADYFFQIGQAQEAGTKAKLAEMAAVDDAAMVNNLATLYARNKHYNEAIALLQRAIAWEPWNPALQSNLEKIRTRVEGNLNEEWQRLRDLAEKGQKTEFRPTAE